MNDRLLAGIGFLAAALACFATMDVATQAITSLAPVVMVLFLRNAMQTALAAAVIAPRRAGARWWPRHPGLQLLRGALLLGCGATAFLGLAVMPVANFTAIVLLTPLTLTALAAWRGSVPVSAAQWLLVIGAACGAMLIVRPDPAALGASALLPLVVIVINTGYQWLTAQLSRHEDAGTMQLWSGLTGVVLTGVLLPWSWRPLPGRAWALLALLGVLGTAAHGLIIHAYRRAPVAVLTPYIYMQIAFATLGGWLAFGQMPDARAALGIVFIAACGAGGTWLAARAQRRARQLNRGGTQPCTSS